MTTQLPTRAAIDRAEPLDFDRKPARQDLTITIKAVVDSFPVEVCFTGSIDQLLGVTKRLRELGAAQPTIAPAVHTAPLNGNGKPKAERVEPIYQSDGSACCPVHKRELKQGQWGLFCSAKDRETGEYCKLKFNE